MSDPEVGVVGLGNMGRGVAENLVGSGRATAVWDIGEERREAFRGRAAIVPPGEMAAAGATIFYVVPATPEIEQTLEGADGVYARARPGTVIYDLTTSFPDDTRRVAARAAESGIDYLDAAMSGGATGADKGTLTLMIGGGKAAFERTRDLLEPVSANVFFLGPSGAGHAMKLIHNMVTHAIFLTNCEAGRIAEAAGISLADMIAVFNVSNARSYASEARFPAHILSEKWDARSRVYNLDKDLAMAVRMAEASGVDARYARETSDFLKQAIGQGMAEDDYSLLYPAFDRIRGAQKQ